MQQIVEQINRGIKEGRWSEVERLSAALLVSSSDLPDVLAARGLALRNLGRDGDALEMFVRATQLRPIFPDAWLQREELLAKAANPTPRYSVSVITPTIGSQHLSSAIESVQKQTYPFVNHLIVVDGVHNLAAVQEHIPKGTTKQITLCTLPVNVGADGYCGHRVYGAFPYLVDSEYVVFLDEDNFFAPDHLSTCMEFITQNGLSWVYALRRLVDSVGGFIANDDCESLGRWPVWHNKDGHLVDANCYVLRKDIAVQLSAIWFRRFRDGVNPDFLLCKELLRRFPRCDTTGRYTVNYRIGASPDSVSLEFFLAGNRQQSEKYGKAFPWRR
jgi:hypothetical protein